MLGLGIIGTNWITEQFIEATHDSGAYKLMSIYSRKKETGLAFGATYGVTNVATNLEEFLTDDSVEVVYIASPNSLHFEQSYQALAKGKHVIVEKPAVTSPEQWRKLTALAKEKQCFFFEAARNLHETSFKKVTALLPENQEILGANLNFMKYSSRYDLVLAGEEPNIFSLNFAGGALMDLGVYVVYAAVAWFGKPETSHYFSRKVATGVDGLGTIILRYPGFDVTMQTGKIANSELPSEIYTTTGTIQLDAVNSIGKVRVAETSGAITKVPVSQEENPMVEEAQAFATVITDSANQDNLNQYEKWLAIGEAVHEVMAELRKDSEIVFTNDRD